MDDTKKTMGADDANFGNAETIPSNPVYIANFEGDEIDGKRYSLGEAIDSKVDAGTIRFLVQNGRISEQEATDSGASPLGTREATNPAGATFDPTIAVRNMDRNALLAELSAEQSDDDLRAAVERKRAYLAEGRTITPISDVAGSGATGGAETGTGLAADDFDAETFIGRTLDAISDDELQALTPEQREAVRKAEKDREQPRTGLLTRLDKLDAPAS
jgi:hypothetical protein